jgi:hypothetical protein
MHPFFNNIKYDTVTQYNLFAVEEYDKYRFDPERRFLNYMFNSRPKVIVRSGSCDLYTSKDSATVNRGPVRLYDKPVCSDIDDMCIRVELTDEIKLYDVSAIDDSVLSRLLSAYMYLNDLRTEGTDDSDPDEVLRREFNTVSSIDEFFTAHDTQISHMFGGCHGFVRFGGSDDTVMAIVLCPLAIDRSSLIIYKEETEPVYCI